MKFLRPLCLIFANGMVFGQQPASLSGTVLDVSSRTPLRGVHVQLIPDIPNTAPYGTNTNGDGRFSFNGVPAGSYTLVPRFASLVFQPLDPADPLVVPAVTLAPGESKDLRVGMTPKAVISGRVTDQARVPLENLTIQVEADARHQAALRFYRQHYQLSTAIRTDDRGDFRFSVPPGAYFVRANTSTLDRIIGASASTGGVYMDTYFPSTPKPTQAVEALAGREAAHSDIVLLEKRSYTISGTVSGLQAGSAIIMVTALPARGGRFIQANPNGSFSIRNLASGTYVLHAENSADKDPPARRRSPDVEVNLLDHDMDGINLTMGEVVHLTGHIEAVAGASITSIKLAPAAMYSNAPSFDATVNARGDFEIEKVNAERYKVVLTSPVPNAYARKVELNGTAVADRILDLRHTGGSAKTTIHAAVGSRVSGKVTAAGGALTLRGLLVILDPLDKALPTERRRTFIDENGAYSFDAVPHGRYRITTTPSFSTGNLPATVEEIDAALASTGLTIEVTADLKKDIKHDEKLKEGSAK